MRLLVLTLCICAALWARIGSVTHLEGDAMLHRAAASVHVVEGLDIAEQETVQTEPKSRVQVRLEDATLITVGPQSEYRFVAFGTGSDPHAEMEIRRGFFKAVTGSIGKVAPERFQIRTNQATIGVRGTRFMGHVEPGREAIGCSQGALVVMTPSGRYEIGAGQMLLFEAGRWQLEAIDYKRFAPVLDDAQGLGQLTDEILTTIDGGIAEEAVKERDRALEQSAPAGTLPEEDPGSQGASPDQQQPTGTYFNDYTAQ